MPADRIVAFYSGGTDDRGRTIEDIWSWSDDQLEAVHDYIQWVFPTIRRSGVNPSAPVITGDTIRAFETRPELGNRLRRSFDRMLAFYGMTRRATADPNEAIAIDDARFAERSRTWLSPGNHNHLRLTRIMESLATLGLRPDAKGLQRCLVDLSEGAGRGRITRDTRKFWVEAVE